MSSNSGSRRIQVEKKAHVNEKRKIGRISPKADLSQLVEHESLGFELLGLVGVVLERFGETKGKLENGIGRSRESIALCGKLEVSVLSCESRKLLLRLLTLTEEDVVIFPVFRKGEALMETTVLVGLCEQER